MVELVHDSGWDREPSWPAGLQEWDLAVLARNWGSSVGVRYEVTDPGPGWTSLGTYSSRPGATRLRNTLFWARVASGALPTVARGNNFTQFRLIVLRGASGFGRARTGIAQVPAQPGGGAVAIGVDLPTAGDLDVLPGARYGTSVAWGAADREGVFGNEGRTHSHTRVYELLPPEGPLAPLVLTPGDGEEVSASTGVAFGWQHRPAIAGGSQDAYQLAVSDDDSGEELFWDASVGAWVEAEAVNGSVGEGVTVPPGVLSVKQGRGWGVRIREGADGRWSVWSRLHSVLPVDPPAVQVTGPGVVHNSLSPLVEWTAQTPRGSQTAFRVRLAEGLAGVVYDSGVRPGDATSWQVPGRELVNGALVQALVQVQQTGGSWSAWATHEFVVSWDEPVPPVVSAVPVRDGVAVTVVDSGLATARQALLDALAAYTDAPVQWSTTEPGDTSVVWVDPATGVGRVWSAGVGGSVDDVVTRRNLITNPSFEVGVLDWSTGGSVSLVRLTGGSATSGSAMLHAVGPQPSTNNIWVETYADLEPED